MWSKRTLFVFALLTAGVCGSLKEEEADDKYVFKVFRILPTSEEELEAVADLYRKAADLQVDFWKMPTKVGAFVDVMVPPESMEIALDYFKSNNLDFWTTIEDVERLTVQREKSQPPSWARPNATLLANNPLLSSFFRKRMSDDYFSGNKAKYGFGDYHSYDTMVKWMREIERFYPQMAQVFTIGTTHEGRQITGIKIGSPISDSNKRAVWVDGGMHAREWAAIHTALFFIEQLIAGYNVDPQVTAYVNTLNFYVVPVANPDGFEFSRSDGSPQTRFWRKNRGAQVCRKDHWRRDRCCSGVDLNRNFDFHFGESGSSNDICSDIYAGASAFSEPESRAIRDKMLSAELRGKVDAYISLHSYSQMWIHPFNHEPKSFPNDIKDLEDVGKRGVAAIEKVYGTKFRFGTGADILYPSAGGSDDWAKAKAGVKYVYLLELRPGEEAWDGFLLDRKELVPTGKETWEGVKIVIDAIMNRARNVQQPPPRIVGTLSPSSRTAPPSPSFTPVTQTPPTSARPALIGRRIDQESLRVNLHDRLQRLRQSQMEARRRYEETLRQEQQQQFRVQPGQTFLQFTPQMTTMRPTAPGNNNAQFFTQQSRFQTACVDRSRWCAAWLRANPQLCSTSAIYMRNDCVRSCRFC